MDQDDGRRTLWCTVCLCLDRNEAATTIASGHALCTKHFMTTQRGISRKIHKAWRARGR